MFCHRTLAQPTHRPVRNRRSGHPYGTLNFGKTANKENAVTEDLQVATKAL